MQKLMKWAGLALAGIVLGSPAAALAAKDLFVVDLVDEPSSLDPHGQWNPDSYFAYRNIFDNVVTRDNDGKIVPQIATAWRYVSDTVIEFDIRGGVKFHDGKPLTAEDVVYSVKRITNPDYKSPQLSQFNAIVDAEAVGADKVRLTTKGPYPVLLAQLVKLSIVPEHIAGSVTPEQFNANPVGSGPYKFAGMQRGVKVTLTANPDYWGPKGPFPTVEFRPVPDVSTRIADLRTGKADFVVTLQADHVKALKGERNIKIFTVLAERVAYFHLNSFNGPTKDPRVRQAIAHAIDKNLIVQALLGGYEATVNEMLSPAHVGYVDGFKGYAHDTAKAKALLAEAGAAAKEPMTLITAPVFDQNIVQALQQMLTDVGLNVKIATSDMASWLRRYQGPPADSGELMFSRWSCACQDADGVLYPLLHSSSGWSKYKNAELDQELDKGRAAIDPAERVKHYRRVHEIVEQQVPLVPLYQAAIHYGARKELVWQPTANESLFLNRMSWTE